MPRQPTQRRLGQYMTPDAVADTLVATLRHVPSQWQALDPACGDGNLLRALGRALQRAGIPDVHRRLAGIDLDAGMVRLARQRLGAALRCREEELNIRRADFLGADVAPDVTVIVANPPYGQGREADFFDRARKLARPGTELVFLLPLAFLDRARGDFTSTVLPGRPLGVTTGHVIVRHVVGTDFALAPVRRREGASREFDVLTGVKLYELGAGTPPQTADVVRRKPFSSPSPRFGWLPCARTGDISLDCLRLDRLWVDYGEHLAHPKTLDRFTGPKLFVRRVPIWAGRRIGAVYTDDLALCAGDVLVVRHRDDDAEALRGLAAWLQSADAARAIYRLRPSFLLRESFPKISARDLNALIASREVRENVAVAA